MAAPIPIFVNDGKVVGGDRVYVISERNGCVRTVTVKYNRDYRKKTHRFILSNGQYLYTDPRMNQNVYLSEEKAQAAYNEILAEKKAAHKKHLKASLAAAQGDTKDALIRELFKGWSGRVYGEERNYALDVMAEIIKEELGIDVEVTDED